MKPKPATVQQLIEIVNAFNTAHELDLRHPPTKENPLLDNLYIAATNAAKSLGPLADVKVKTIQK